MIVPLQANRSTTGVIPDSMRLAWRLPYGDLASVLKAAEDEYRQDALGNAWACYQMALSYWMRCRWVEFSGKTGTPIIEPEQLATKMRSSGMFDKTLAEMVKPLCGLPKGLTHMHVDVASATVRALTCE